MPNETRKTVFIARLPELSSGGGLEYSSAGHQVQKKILEELVLLYGSSGVKCISIRPARAWPRGKFYFPLKDTESVLFLGIINIPIIRNIFTFFFLFKALVNQRNEFQVFYNAYLSDVFVVFLQRLVGMKRKSCLIIQDVRVGGKSFSIRARIHDYLAMHLAKYFDLCVSISPQIILDFHLNHTQNFVFRGGITYFGEYLLSSEAQLDEIAVFAGALEPYNGILKLVNEWIQQDINIPLHIFGRGSEEVAIRFFAGEYKNIIFHGFKSEVDVINWQKSAMINICFRFDSGLNQRYFFPSKFFNIICAPGYVLVNNFFGLPKDIVDNLLIVDDNMSQLKSCLSSVIEEYKYIGTACNDNRRELISKNFSWAACVKQIDTVLNKQ